MKNKCEDASLRDGKWFYTDKVKDHFFNPRNILKTDKEIEEYEADGVGIVGSPACGDEMKMLIKIDDGRVNDVKWQTFGCATAIASTSVFSEMLLENGGMKIDDALKIKPKDIINYLGGIPAIKFHCSVLADKAFKEALKDYKTKRFLNNEK